MNVIGIQSGATPPGMTPVSLNPGMEPAIDAGFGVAWRSTPASGGRMMTGGQRSFMEVMGRRLGGAGDGSDEGSRAAEARDAAEQLVAITFVQPVLKQLRESNEAAPPFAPTQGERQFRALLDAELAQEITRAAQFPLVDRLARDLLRLPPEPGRMPGDGRSP